jgi:hypothetical protein
MGQMMACCGIPCSECGAFIATKNDDDEKRAETAREWSQQFSCDIKPEDINCDGCTSDGDRLFSHPKVCEIRKCARTKTIANCAYCDEYPCEKLEELFNAFSLAKENLDKIRSSL